MDKKSLSDFSTVKPGSNKPDIDLSIGDMPTQDLAHDLDPIGDIDRYKLIKPLGAGGFGTVYLALDSEADINVALKVLPSEVARIPEELENVRNNFALVLKLLHPNIAGLLHLHKVVKADVAAEKLLRIYPGAYLVVMEYVEGFILTVWRKQFDDKKVPFDKTIEICGKVADALDFAHENNVIHRDINPSNIMITSDSKVKVLDFGLAAEVRSSMGRVSTKKFDTSGTRPYMAPEQLVGERQTAETDQYALAVMFYELISGKVPFQSVFETGDTMLMVNVVESRQPKPLPELSKKQNAALLCALSKKPKERFSSCREFITALGGGKVAGKRPKVPVPTAKKSRSRKMVLAMMVLVLLTGCCWFGWDAYQKNERENARVMAEKKAHAEAKAEAEAKARAEAKAIAQKEARTKVEAARLAKFQHGHRQQILNAMSQAQRLYKQRKYADALQAIQTVLNLDFQNAEAQSLQNEISNIAGLALVSPVRGEAEVIWENVQKISIADGFDADIRKIKILLKSTEVLFRKEDYSSALKGYQKIISRCKVLEKLDQIRKAANKARAAMVSAKSGAERVDAAVDAKALYASANRIASDAEKLLKKHEFDDAVKLYNSALKSYKKAEAYAKGYQAVIPLRQRYEELVNNASMKELKSYGGVSWSKASLAANKAESMSRRGNWSEAIEAYENALIFLPNALKLAKGGAELLRKKNVADVEFKRVCSDAEKYHNLDQKDPKSFDACQMMLKAIDDFMNSSHYAYVSVREKQNLNDLKNKIKKFKKTLWNGSRKDQPYTVPDLGLKMVYVDSGSFMMGSNDGDDDEKPVHRVTISKGYWIGKYEVTQNEYQTIIGTNPSHFKGDRRPIEQISRNEIVKFCRKLTEREKKAERLQDGYVYRLPTEAEWEYAARGGKKSRGYEYSGSNDLDEVLAESSLLFGKTHVVGTKKANELGIYDMSGNVMELCLDKCRYSSGVVTDTYRDGIVDPVCRTGSSSIVRGGSWFRTSTNCRVAHRGYTDGKWDESLGFRVVLAPVLSEKSQKSAHRGSEKVADAGDDRTCRVQQDSSTE